MERQKTAIQMTRQTKIELMKIKGELLSKDGLKRTMDDVIRELIGFWKEEWKKRGYSF